MLASIVPMEVVIKQLRNSSIRMRNFPLCLKQTLPERLGSNFWQNYSVWVARGGSIQFNALAVFWRIMSSDLPWHYCTV
ncbi:hypothetical protein XAC3218_1120018 [Xanthomonas citri pv. citri]|nr:hypothetical protein XAC3218_1120018 [Xanthomonas citri pv. citri]CEH83469.1 hypothetical protein XACB302_10730005 [Xanthomonas citri pv. citri]